ncbi:dihydrofolate reductase family protein [Nocardioides ginsengisoli]|uniref:Dihydrofolate reductase family protein n=1 Tax=Nocardioides ginsengisoli TaxID=363868 RepID=A0ABW3W285_9ACTN
MRKVTYSMGVTLDGFIKDADGSFDWGDPDPDVFAHSMDEIQEVGVHLLGRRLYETMLYWETHADDPALSEMEREWTTLWNPLPKVVFSRTLTEVEGAAARLATGTLAEEIARLRAEPGEGDIALGGAELAAQAAEQDLIDEYLIRVFPVVVGGGTPFFARDEQRRRLELVETRTFSSSGVVYLRHRRVR